ncbi:hypothetical protein FDF29_11935 [Clostridium botulinum]|uniref:Phage protein n=2 Tax=Clostridium botulinum TaxID=1491 RepID=A5I2I0_CLOBH|nr:YopX family protein [Clostridium botulinum]NEZ93712.1 hypothetical protein [Clostridium botulinum]NFL68387.1 hypothetical protein [Clostridium botulinum]NFQ52566.1 hypothetical protein [Clostridium botulinum]NFT46946.1 hypothetical protein [Clostridium botulinum]QGT42464.1 hypothetical protein GJ703_00641 [Clostridium botulinum]
MREIKFRGKSLDNNEWVYGGYYNMPDCRKDNPRHIIVYQNNGPGQLTIHEPIDINTLGQYTGLKDINGKEIYEGDILQINIKDKTIKNKIISAGNEVVEYKNCKFGVVWGWHRDFIGLDGFYNANFEVVGNIYENPVLLEG